LISYIVDCIILLCFTCRCFECNARGVKWPTSLSCFGQSV